MQEVSGSLAALAESRWKELPSRRDFRSLLAVQPLLRGTRLPVVMLYRTRQSFPVSGDLLAVNGLRIREHV